MIAAIGFTLNAPSRATEYSEADVASRSADGDVRALCASDAVADLPVWGASSVIYGGHRRGVNPSAVTDRTSARDASQVRS